MRILVVSNLFPTASTPWGGTFLTRRVEALERAGHDVDVWALVPERTGLARMVGALWSMCRRSMTAAGHSATVVAPYQQLVIPMNSWEYLRAWRRRLPRRAISRAASRLASVIDLDSYDLVIAHGMYMVPAGCVAEALEPPLGYAVVCHGSDINHFMPMRAKEYARTLDCARARVFVSSALEARARELGMTATDSAVIPNGVDLERFRPDRRRTARQEFGIAVDARVVSFVGNLALVKGADRVPAIMRRVWERDPEVVCLIAGDGALMGQVRRALSGGNVRLLGRLEPDGVAKVMAATDVLMLPSRSEGWPSVIFEAFASGTAVVGAAVGGIPEALAVADGLVVASGPALVSRFADAVCAALEEPPTPSSLVAVAQQHRWDDIVASELDEMEGHSRRA